MVRVVSAGRGHHTRFPLRRSSLSPRTSGGRRPRSRVPSSTRAESRPRATTTRSPPPPFVLALPDEVVHAHILSLLLPATLARFAKVCKAWRALADAARWIQLSPRRGPARVKGAALRQPKQAVRVGGLLLVANDGDQQLRAVEAATGTRRWAVRKGNGQAELNNPLCICHNPHSDEVIVCDHRNHRLQVYQLLRDATTGAITAGAWVRTIAPPVMREPVTCCFDATPLTAWVACNDDKVHAIDLPTGTVHFTIGAFGGASGAFHRPAGIAFLNHEVFVCDLHNHRVQIFCAVSGRYLRKWGRRGGRSGRGHREFNLPWGICAAGGLLYITECANRRIQVITPGGVVVHTITLARAVQLGGISVDAEAGVVYVADAQKGQIHVLDRQVGGAQAYSVARRREAVAGAPEGSWLRNERAWATEVEP